MCITPTRTIVAPKVIKRLAIDNIEKKLARFSARNQANPGIVRFCKRITRPASLKGRLNEGLFKRRIASQGATITIAMATGIEINDKSRMVVEITPERSREVS